MVFGMVLAVFGILMAGWLICEIVINDIVTICRMRTMKKRR